MYRPPDVETLEDFHQYYRQSYIGWRNPDPVNGQEFVPVSVGDSDGRTVIELRFQNDRKVVPFKDVLNNAQFGTPQYGATEYRDTALYVSRRAARHAGRGHRHTNLNMYEIHTGPDGLDKGLLLSWDYLKNLFNPSYRSLEEAFALLGRKERRACVLSRHFILASVEGYKAPCLFYKHQIIGNVENPYTIELEDPEEYKTLVQESFSGVLVK